MPYNPRMHLELRLYLDPPILDSLLRAICLMRPCRLATVVPSGTSRSSDPNPGGPRPGPRWPLPPRRLWPEVKRQIKRRVTRESPVPPQRSRALLLHVGTVSVREHGVSAKGDLSDVGLWILAETARLR